MKRQQARQEVEVVMRKKFDHGEIKFPLELTLFLKKLHNNFLR